MNYKEIIEIHFERYEGIVNELVVARDKFKKNDTEYKYFQNQIESISILKNDLLLDFMQSQIKELKN